MLTDPHEIEIISRAQEKNVRDPKRSRKPFERIFEDFGFGNRVRGKTLLDLGPGQYDFAAVALAFGAAEVWSIDRDSAVIELGRYKGLPIIAGELRDFAHTALPRRFDGVFCKYSIDAFWFGPGDEEQHRAHIAAIADALEPHGWAWLAPWNGAHTAKGLSESDVENVLRLQREAFVAEAFDVFELTEDLTIRYGVHGLTAGRPLFTRNLPLPRELEVHGVHRARTG